MLNSQARCCREARLSCTASEAVSLSPFSFKRSLGSQHRLGLAVGPHAYSESASVWLESYGGRHFSGDHCQSHHGGEIALPFCLYANNIIVSVQPHPTQLIPWGKLTSSHFPWRPACTTLKEQLSHSRIQEPLSLGEQPYLPILRPEPSVQQHTQKSEVSSPQWGEAIRGDVRLTAQPLFLTCREERTFPREAEVLVTMPVVARVLIPPLYQSQNDLRLSTCFQVQINLQKVKNHSSFNAYLF